MNVLSPASVAIAAFMLAALPGAQSARPAGAEVPRVRAGATRPASESGSSWRTSDLAERSLCARLSDLEMAHRPEARVRLPNFTTAGSVHYKTPRLA